MKIESQPREDQQVELTVEFEPATLEEFKKRAAKRWANRVKIPGFRPGKAPYNVVVRQIGEAPILEEALDILAERGEAARIVAGGTDLILEMERGVRKGITTLIDITRVSGLDQIVMDEDEIIHLGPLGAGAAVKTYPTIGVCGLDCGLCPRYYTVGASRCPGCCGS